MMATIGELIGLVASGQVKILVGTALPLSQLLKHTVCLKVDRPRER